MIQHQKRLDQVLATVAQIPAKIDWHVLTAGEFVVICDDRNEATMLELEAIAGQHGEVVAQGNCNRTASDRELAGVLIRPATNPESATKALRAAYAIATDDNANEGPF